MPDASKRTWRARYEGSVLEDLAKGMTAADFGNRIVLIGASLLLSVLPLIILISAFASTSVDDDIARHLGLDERGTEIVRQLIRPNHGLAVNLAVIASLTFSFAGTVTVASLVQSMYEGSFRQPHLKSGSNMARRIVWVLCAGFLLVFDAEVGGPIDKGPVGPELLGLFNLVFMTLFCWWTLHFLLSGRVAWRRLLPAAVITAILWVGLGIFAALYFASTLVSDSRLYGTIGVVFTLVAWFIALAGVIGLGAVGGAVWQDRSDRRHGGGDDGVAYQVTV